jgi:hypothetical protein
VVESVAAVPLGLSDPQHDRWALAEVGSAERWRQLQQLRRGLLPAEALVAALASGDLAAEPDLLAALWGRLDRPAVRRLLSSPLGRDPAALLEAARLELPASQRLAALQQAWLDPLLEAHQRAHPARAVLWLELLGRFRDPRVAGRLRATIAALQAPAAALAPLLPLLGLQRQAQDGALLMRLALQPGPLVWRRGALEGVAVGLSAWPLPRIAAGLQQLAGDLDPALAAAAVDLLARLPDGQRQLRHLQGRRLDSGVAARLQRRLQRSPLVLVVHGRQGGVIPAVYHELARSLEHRRGAPVLLQALTGDAPQPDARFRLAGRRAGAITLVPLLLLPGEHVRGDLPALASAWRAELAGSGSWAAASAVRRLPFLGAWPAWQQLLARVLRQADGGRGLIWLHHPVQGPLCARFLGHLERVLGRPGLPSAALQQSAALPAPVGGAAVLAPLSLAPSRLTESLNMASFAPSVEVLPPLLDLPAVHEFLLASLEALP